MEETQTHDEMSDKPRIDNPWLLWLIPVFLTALGGTLGFVFGPLLMAIKGPSGDQNPNLDFYASGSFQANLSFSAYGALLGLVIGGITVYNLTKFPKKDATELPGGSEH